MQRIKIILKTRKAPGVN
ncbi:hypothetical protein S40285_09581 [Stachybotrys chlorohalonatus IBT 40285]|uniref:Uncharacterized protein n=1 Tax=Stachybotrys chlorohalonatus (strain IBT 40285) TaxID=1283841 RepID=A0A084QXF7_STAC4|nr:hypothetical protein S40285_09581 [Stachybotrys chlorohalonata IBT 40285]